MRSYSARFPKGCDPLDALPAGSTFSGHLQGSLERANRTETSDGSMIHLWLYPLSRSTRHDLFYKGKRLQGHTVVHGYHVRNYTTTNNFRISGRCANVVDAQQHPARLHILQPSADGENPHGPFRATWRARTVGVRDSDHQLRGRCQSVGCASRRAWLAQPHS